MKKKTFINTTFTDVDIDIDIEAVPDGSPRLAQGLAKHQWGRGLSSQSQVSQMLKAKRSQGSVATEKRNSQPFSLLHLSSWDFHSALEDGRRSLAMRSESEGLICGGINGLHTNYLLQPLSCDKGDREKKVLQWIWDRKVFGGSKMPFDLEH